MASSQRCLHAAEEALKQFDVNKAFGLVKIIEFEHHKNGWRDFALVGVNERRIGPSIFRKSGEVLKVGGHVHLVPGLRLINAEGRTTGCSSVTINMCSIAPNLGTWSELGKDKDDKEAAIYRDREAVLLKLITKLQKENARLKVALDKWQQREIYRLQQAKKAEEFLESLR
ncbi:hypothetical protein K440DRAFT_665217 [Wilcoxina mikolae CBS 423.85]|nr:hypothetical protein K440DRAFT_665217 [Wilcoxina mikolae CBS 423.85]